MVISYHCQGWKIPMSSKLSFQLRPGHRARDIFVLFGGGEDEGYSKGKKKQKSCR